ncbi:MAG: GrpB family protein [Oscillospiraceae bacterium]
MREDWSNVTDERLAALFPIILEAHNPDWKNRYEAEKVFLLDVFGAAVVRISHIGSTAVAGLTAKPTVDILLEIKPDTDLTAITALPTEKGYVVNTSQIDIVMIIKGYTPRGFEGQAFHIHVRHSADWGELYFRDFLIAHPDAARAYEELKINLKAQYEHDRDGYTDAKGAFIRAHTEQARDEFPHRYTPQDAG